MHDKKAGLLIKSSKFERHLDFLCDKWTLLQLLIK